MSTLRETVLPPRPRCFHDVGERAPLRALCTSLNARWRSAVRGGRGGTGGGGSGGGSADASRGGSRLLLHWDEALEIADLSPRPYRAGGGLHAGDAAVGPPGPAARSRGYGGAAQGGDSCEPPSALSQAMAVFVLGNAPRLPTLGTPFRFDGGGRPVSMEAAFGVGGGATATATATAAATASATATAVPPSSSGERRTGDGSAGKANAGRVEECGDGAGGGAGGGGGCGDADEREEGLGVHSLGEVPHLDVPLQGDVGPSGVVIPREALDLGQSRAILGDLPQEVAPLPAPARPFAAESAEQPERPAAATNAGASGADGQSSTSVEEEEAAAEPAAALASAAVAVAAARQALGNGESTDTEPAAAALLAVSTEPVVAAVEPAAALATAADALAAARRALADDAAASTDTAEAAPPTTLEPDAAEPTAAEPTAAKLATDAAAEAKAVPLSMTTQAVLHHPSPRQRLLLGPGAAVVASPTMLGLALSAGAAEAAQQPPPQQPPQQPPHSQRPVVAATAVRPLAAAARVVRPSTAVTASAVRVVKKA